MKNKTLKTTFAVITAIGLLMTGCSTSTQKVQQSTSSATTGTSSSSSATSSTDLSGVTLRVASLATKAIFKAAGQDDTPYTVQYQTYTGGSVALQTMAADQVDLVTTSEIPPLYAALTNGGGNFKIVATYQSNALLQDLIVGPKSTITSVKQLKGKKVGYVKATTSQYFLLKMLTAAGLTWKDIQPVNLTPSDGESALISGDISAFAVFGNPITTNTQQGGKILSSAQNILSGNYFLVANANSLKNSAKKAAILDYIQRLQKVFKWERSNYAKFAAIQAPLSGMTTQQYIVYAKTGDAQRETNIHATIASDFTKWQDVSNVLYSIGALEKKVQVKTLYSSDLESQIKKLIG